MAGRMADTTLYVVTYDVADNRRRTKVHQVLTGFGSWVQYSVFECHLTKKELLLLRTKLSRHLDPKQDNLRVYTLCESCLGRVETIGSEKPIRTHVYLV